ncbi:hypothetical protein L6164_003063 [Bauhinia variegata]|uniref:Uncharacterized protein n=1 Tax=Bauhinia variegata TaxID=167791 RepID=A0ACB9Q5N2_BAUVA|nr:hypothetical protein L6164_003063 [Bauhinia variegata]
MAEQIPYGIAESLIKRLASSVFAEFGRIYGVKDKLAKLRETIESIGARLLDAEERQEQEDGHVVKNWITRLKKVLHDADDLFDNFVDEDLRDKVGGHGKICRKARKFFSSSNPIVFRYNMACEIEAIQKKFNDVANDMSKLNLCRSGRVFKENVSEWRKTSSFVEETEIIGREESKKEIINLLMQTSDNPNVSLIAIVGAGGLGKTALAQLVYNDAQVQKFFAKHIWVCVSEDFGVETLLKKILKSLSISIVDNLELDQLQRELRQCLSGQRYLLVLDDVWNKSYENWNHLKRYLTCAAPGSKILVTTRLEEVVEVMRVSTPYYLEGLNKTQSLTLFKKLAFGENEKTINPNLLSIGEQIVEKCGGVPLAIRALGSLLRTKNGEINEWLRILHGDVWRLSEDTERVMVVLKLSYKHLPIELRQCFAYCSLYPKDMIIDKEELVQLWMAQGYLGCSTEMEDVGNDYVKILLMRSFFQDVEMDEDGDIECFKMHDLMHDLAMLVAGTDCYLHAEGRRTIGTPTHLSLHDAPSIPLDLMDKKRVRTIIHYPIWNFASLEGGLPIWSCKSLRVLKLCDVKIKKLPKSIGNLKHLRYLDLSGGHELRRLPNSVRNLVFLQTFKLSYCVKLEISVEVFTNLINLRHLDVRYCKAFESGMSVSLGELKSLQHLPVFYMGDVDNTKRRVGKLNELRGLNNLRGRLAIENLRLVKDVESESKEVNLKEKKYLSSLSLDWGRYSNENCKNSDASQLLENLCPHQNLKRVTVDGYPGVSFSSWISSLANIVQITIRRCDNCQNLPPLERLPSLKYLRISHMYALEYIYYEWPHEKVPRLGSSSSLSMPTTCSFFISLERLDIDVCPNLKGWKRTPTSVNETDIENHQHQEQHLSLPPFPCLSSLSISTCPNLACMPTYPLVELFELWYGCSMKPLIDTLEMKTKNGASTAAKDEDESERYAMTSSWCKSPSCPPLSALKSLTIVNIGIESLPEQWMKNLTCLKRLCISYFPRLAPIFRYMRHLPSPLEKLEIWYVDNFDMPIDEIEDVGVSTQFQVLHCLCSLQIIEIDSCENLKTLPEWICSLTSIQRMFISYCSNLESLPEGMHGLTNLQELIIGGCPLLRKRYAREKVAGWPNLTFRW